MALRTNSKQAKANLNKYISQAADYLRDCGYDQAEEFNLDNDLALSAAIWEVFNSEKYYTIDHINKMRISWYEVFKEWAQGLALNLFDYYYNVSAVNLLGDILEETEAERNKYSEEQAEETLTRLIYRTITENREKYNKLQEQKQLELEKLASKYDPEIVNNAPVKEAVKV